MGIADANVKAVKNPVRRVVNFILVLSRGSFEGIARSYEEDRKKAL